MKEIDIKRGGLEDFPFTYRKSGDEKVFISWRGKAVMTLKGNKAKSFLEKSSKQDGIEEQLTMAKITGNFKRGNER